MKRDATKLDKLVQHLNKYLRVGEIADSAGNGLQVQGPDEVNRVAFAVDARRAVFEAAAAWNAQLIIVHHGLLWDKVEPLVGPRYDRIRVLIERKVALYAVHLPLDAHPEVGNNAELARVLGLEERRPAGEYHGVTIGVGGSLLKPAAPSTLAARLSEATGFPPVRVIDAGIPAQRVACVSGLAAEMADQIAAEGYDTFVTGELTHASIPVIEELGINVIFGGHYATETLGVKALAAHVERQFGLETRFIDIPTHA